MRAALVIPARLGSTRLCRKLLLDRTGLPLVCHTVDAALAARREDPDRIREVLVATDDAEIREAVAAHAERRGAPVRAVLTRGDHPSGTDRIAEAVGGLGPETEAVVNLQGDEPEMAPGAVLALLDALETGRGLRPPACMATLAYPIADAETFRDPNRVKVVRAADGCALYFSRAPVPHAREAVAGEVPPEALLHLGIYAYTREALERFVALPPSPLEAREKLEQLRAIENGIRIAVALPPVPPAAGIDTAEDYDAFVRRMRARGAEA
jgi:3-deoxy-manno-octulosonate cytidylyltransferase (CMP-KDO synthetase)